MTAKSVIASANRLIEVRQRCRNKNKIAEISVPACPMPTQKTKFTIVKCPTHRNIQSPDANPFPEQLADSSRPALRPADADRRNTPSQSPEVFRSATPEIVSVILAND